MSAANREGPEAVVARQLAAYNARDIDAFMACWREDAQVRFQEPDLFARLVVRISAGTMVVDREVVTRNFPEGRGEIDVIAIYEVDGDKIAKAWFKSGARRLTP